MTQLVLGRTAVADRRLGGGPLQQVAADVDLVALEPVTPLLGCRVSVFELTGSCTLVTIESPVVNYPALSGLVPRVTERLTRVVHTLLAAGNLNAA